MEDDDTFSGEVPWRHGIAHEGGGIDDQDVAFSSDTARKILRQVCALQVENIARLARTLASVPEDGTMLDHTVIVFLSDNGATHHSNAEHWPLLLLGEVPWDSDSRPLTGLTEVWSSKQCAPKSGLQHAGHVAGFNLTDWGEPDKATMWDPWARSCASTPKCMSRSVQWYSAFMHVHIPVRTSVLFSMSAP